MNARAADARPGRPVALAAARDAAGRRAAHRTSNGRTGAVAADRGGRPHGQDKPLNEQKARLEPAFCFDELLAA